MVLQLKKKKHPMVSSYGKYVAKVMHFNTITAEDIEREIQDNCTAKASDVQLVTRELYATIIRHLQDGDRVEIPNMGIMKLEARCTPVDSPEEFDQRKHVKSFSLHFIPKSKRGKPEMYQGIEISKVIRDK